MSTRPNPDRDERLRELGRQWFADVRRQNEADEAVRRRQEAASGDADGGWLDWLFDGDCQGDDSGDGGSCSD